MIIGVSPILDDIQDSGLFLTELPSIRFDVAEASLTKEHESVVSFMKERIVFAEKIIKNKIKVSLRPIFEIPSVISNDTVGVYQENRKIVPTEAGERGIRVQIDEGSFLRFNLNSVTVFSSTTNTSEIVVRDLITGQLLDSFEFNLSADVQKLVPINRSYDTKKQKLHLFIGYDSTIGEPYETFIEDGRHRNRCNSCNHGHGRNRGIIEFDGAKLLGIARDSNIVVTNDTFGLTLDYSLECSLDSIVNSLDDLIGLPLLYQTELLLLQENKNSNNLNSINIFQEASREEAIALAMDNLQNSLDTAFQSISGIEDNLCVTQNFRLLETSALQ